MKYLGTILSFALVIFAAFAILKYTPSVFQGAVSLTASINHILDDATSAQ